VETQVLTLGEKESSTSWIIKYKKKELTLDKDIEGLEDECMLVVSFSGLSRSLSVPGDYAVSVRTDDVVIIENSGVKECWSEIGNMRNAFKDQSKKIEKLEKDNSELKELLLKKEE